VTKQAWLSAVLLFFAWGFAMHASGLLLHEFGGHALASAILACGIEGYDLTFFGHGQVHYADCTSWTETRIVIASWAGLFITTAAGLAAGLMLRRPSLSPMARLLVALVAFSFLLGQLGYMTTGGFHDLYDPGRTARWLGRRGLHVLAWLPPLIAYTASAFLCARAAIDAFREHFGSRTRLHSLLQLAATLGVAGALYFAAFRIEWSLRTDMTMRGVAVEAKRVAEARHAPPPFPIEHVLVAILIASLVYALARPVRSPSEPRPLARPVVKVVGGAAATCFLVLGALIALRR
jgi:hypothetical protein